MFPVINLGPVAIQSYGFILLIGVWLGLSWAEKNAKQYGIESDAVFTVIFGVAIATLLGARIGYVLVHFETFAENWTDIFALNLTIMDWASGVLVGALFLLIYLQRKKIPLWQYLDSMVPFLLVLNAAYAIATFANQTSIGSETALPWGMLVYEKVRHPVQLYHLLTAVFLILLFRPKSKKYLWMDRDTIKEGGYFSLFLFVFAVSFGFIQTFRLNYPTVVGNINLYHFVGFLVIVFAIWQSNKRIMFPEETD
jgi:phosphatidylglycerol---prolipoprotein diacylglyceryl transferase